MQINTVGIIGYGDFGGLIEKVVRINFPNIKIKVFSRKQETDGKLFFELEEVCKCDILFPTVPIRHFEETIHNIVQYLDKSTIVVDVCTVKVHTAQVLRGYIDKIKYICTHPMFGPYSFEKIGNKLDDLRFVLSEHNLDNNTYNQIKNILKSLKLKILELTPDEHDKKLAETLFLTHLIGQTITKAGFTRTDIDTLSFGFLMDAVESVKNDIALFQDVYKFDPYCKDVLKKFQEAKKDIIELLE